MANLFPGVMRFKILVEQSLLACYISRIFIIKYIILISNNFDPLTGAAYPLCFKYTYNLYIMGGLKTAREDERPL